MLNPLQFITNLIFKDAVKSILPGLLVGLTLFGTGASIMQGRSAARASRKSNELQQRIADIKAQRERVKLVGEARRKRAALAQSAELSGVAGSSGALAGQSGISSQAASGLSFLDQVGSLGRQSNVFAQQSANASSRGQMFGAVAGVAGSFATATGAWEKMMAGKSTIKSTTPLGIGPGYDILKIK